MARNMAGGGIVAFQNTGLVSGEFGGEGAGESFATKEYDPYFVKDPMTGEVIPSGYRRGVPETGLPKGVDPEAVIRKESAPSAEKKPQFNFPPQGGVGPTDAELGRNAPAPAAPEMFKEPAADQGLSDIKSLLKQRMEESGKQKRIDAYMSLLQAGLGMMGGSSPFAAVNIGQGASTGVAAQMAARKSQVADENAILTGQLGLSRAELYEKMRRDALRQQAEKTAGELKIREATLDVNRQRANEMFRGNQIRQGQLRIKATENWENSSDKANIEKELSTQKKNWRQDSKLLGQFNMIRDRYINSFVDVGQADNTPSATSLLGPQ